MTTKDTIIKNAKKIFAKESLEGLSMRRLASECNIALSVIYHYFASKDELLDELYREIVNEINTKADSVIMGKSVKIKLRQYLEFCFENANDIVFCYKYYLAYRQNFRKNASGYLPMVMTEPIAALLQEGIKNKELKSKDIVQDAKFIVYLIQGMLLEYYPQIPTRVNQESIVQKLFSRLENAFFAS